MRSDAHVAASKRITEAFTAMPRVRLENPTLVFNSPRGDHAPASHPFQFRSVGEAKQKGSFDSQLMIIGAAAEMKNVILSIKYIPPFKAANRFYRYAQSAYRPTWGGLMTYEIHTTRTRTYISCICSTCAVRGNGVQSDVGGQVRNL